MSDSLPPHDANAEESIIASAIENPKWLGPVCRVPSDHFYLQGVRLIHGELQKMNRSGLVVDVVTLHTRLSDDGLLEKSGGVSYLSELMGKLTSAENVPVWIEIVEQKYQLRKILRVCAEVSDRIQTNNVSLDDLKFAVQSDLAEVFGGPTGELPEMVSATEFLSLSMAMPPEIITGVLHRGSKMALGGSSKSFKTWTLIDLAVSVSSGNEWLGLKTSRGRVLYVNFEIQPEMWNRRCLTVHKTKAVDPLNDHLHFWNLRGYAADHRAIIPKIIQRAKSEGYSLIIIDPIYKLYGDFDENSAADVAALLNSLERLAGETGAAVVFGTHFAKGNASTKEAMDRMSGSGVFARDPDSLLIFTRHEEEGAFTVESILRNFPPVSPFVVRWNYPIFEVDDELNPDDLKQSAGRKKVHDALEILSHIADNDILNPISVSDWARLAGINRRTLSDYLAEMRNKDWVKTVGEGTNAKQYITPKGKDLIVK